MRDDCTGMSKKGRLIKKNAVLDNLLERYPLLCECRDSIENAYLKLEQVYRDGGRLYIAGNGGSAADSGHIAGELVKSFMINRPVDDRTIIEYEKRFGTDGRNLGENLQGGLPAMPLSALTTVITAVTNDMDGQYIFSQSLNAFAGKGDAFLGLSTSGNSPDIINAFMVATVKKMIRIGLTGKQICKMDSLCDVVIHVPETETYKVQELHMPVYHALCAMLELRFFSSEQEK